MERLAKKEAKARIQMISDHQSRGKTLDSPSVVSANSDVDVDEFHVDHPPEHHSKAQAERVAEIVARWRVRTR